MRWKIRQFAKRRQMPRYATFSGALLLVSHEETPAHLGWHRLHLTCPSAGQRYRVVAIVGAHCGLYPAAAVANRRWRRRCPERRLALAPSETGGNDGTPAAQ